MWLFLKYVNTINRRFCADSATEQSYRGDLDHLLQTLLPDIAVANKPKRIDYGAKLHSKPLKHPNCLYWRLQHALKWLKDRKGRTLSFEDIQHYKKIIIALTEPI